MASLTRGTTFVTGVANDVTADKLHALVDAATPTSGFIQDRTAETTIAADDTLLFGDFSDSSNLKRMTVANFAGTLPTATITSGTITTLNSTTGTITTGVIPTLTSTTLITTGTGTAAAPAIVPTGDSNTGIFFPAADTIAFSEGGAESMRIDSDGQVGIGSTAPNARLFVTVGSAPNNAQLLIGYLDGSENYFDANTQIFRNGNAAERLRIDSNGNVGIGVSSPISSLHLKHATPTSKITLEDSSTNRVGEIGGGSDGAGGLLTFSVGNNGGTITERLRITSGGYLKASNTGTYVNAASAFHEIRTNSSGDEALILSHSATTTPYGMQIRFVAAPNDATSQFLNCNDGNGATTRAIIRSNGGLQNYQANDGNLSDERLKTDIQPSPSYLDKICSIPVVNFKYKDQTHDDYNLGVIAQQVESVCPEFVDADGVGETPEDGIPIKAIYQTDLQYALMKCIQELKSENDSLKSRIETLEAA